MEKKFDKSVYELLDQYINDLRGQGYSYEDIACALEKYCQGLLDDDVKIANSVSDVSAKQSNSENHYKIVRLKDVGELNYPVYFMCGEGNNIEALPLVWKGYSVNGCDFNQALDQRCYLYDDMNAKDKEKYKDNVEIFVSKHPIQRSALLGLVNFQRDRSKKREK